MNKYERIAEIKAELSYIENHKEKRNQEKQELDLLKLKLDSLQQQLIKENRDVEKLEKTSIVSLFHSIVGSKEEMLEKERHEAMVASVQYHQVLNDYQLKERYIEQLEERLSKEILLESELKTLQLDVFSLENPELKIQLENQISEYEDKKIELKEIEEAIVAGEKSKECFQKVLAYLSSAENWGIYDMVGGGMISSMIKHGKIDDAQNALQLAKNQFGYFEKEIKDIKGWEVHLEVFDLGVVMFDQFFDNIFTDFMVQNKISKSIKNISDVHTKIESALDDLNIKKEEVYQQCTMMNQKVKNILFESNIK